MAMYCIGYELKNPGNTNATLIEEIETYETWWHCLESTWIIASPNSRSGEGSSSTVYGLE